MLSETVNALSLGDKIKLHDALVSLLLCSSGSMMPPTVDEAEAMAADAFRANVGDDVARPILAFAEQRKSLGRQPQQSDLPDPSALEPKLWDLLKLIQPASTTTTTTASNGAPAMAASVTLDQQFLPALNSLIGPATKGQFASVDPLIQAFREAAELRGQVADLSHKLATRPAAALPAEVKGTGNLPTGKVKEVTAADVFVGPGGQKAGILNFKVPAMEWDAPHPLVAEVDPDYQFDPVTLAAYAWAYQQNKNPLLVGQPGTGKTSFLEQFCARLGMPTMRINCDSEITRLDLIGRDVLANDPATGHTISRFVDGILPQAMQAPCVLIVDEVDYIRPDVAYVFQRVLEGNGLLVNEDGGRVIVPHPLFRIAATANTKLQGNSTGAFQGARPQSAAFRDRFPICIEFDYLSEDQEVALLVAKVPGLKEPDARRLVKFADEVRTARKAGDIMETLSPRGLVTLASMMVSFFAIGTGTSGTAAAERKKLMDFALNMTVFNKAETADALVIRGLADRCIPSA
ncbi:MULTISPECIES: MoxR family ATPase [unclassified Azospirillum]|uniref:AAA family ATPase n=1 Tax=unclassified Azospirillum TaxID=2630922 RepID=UPI000D64498C|nr:MULTISPECIES: MoxR family ATPase [unclassified Azospirillum]